MHESRKMGSGVSNFFSSSAKPFRVYQAHDGSINAICLFDQGRTRYLATASEDGTCAVWDTENNKLEAKMNGHSQYVTCIAMNESFVVTGSADKTLKKWDLHTGKHLMTYDGHNSIVANVKLHKNLLFSTSYDKTARQWDLQSGECLQVYKGHKRGLGPLLLVNLNLPDLRSLRRRSRVDIYRRVSVSWSGNIGTQLESFHNMLLITGSSDNTAKGWSLMSHVSVVDFVGHGSGILCLTIKEGQRELFTGSSDGTVRSWDVETGQSLMVFDGHQGAVLCLQVQGNYLFTGSADSTGRWWHCSAGDCIRVYRGHKNTVTSLALGLKGQLLLTAGNDGQVRVWEVATGTCKKVFKGHDYPINCMMVFENQVYSGSYDKTVRVWDISRLGL